MHPQLSALIDYFLFAIIITFLMTAKFTEVPLKLSDTEE